MGRNIDTLLILGASGDLTARFLLPGLGQLLTEEPGRRLSLIGSGTHEWDDARWRETVRDSFSTTGASGVAVEHAVSHSHFLSGDATARNDLQKLIDACDGTAAIYFALPPAVTAKAIQALADVNLPQDTVLALEKPFGEDQQSAAELNERLASLVPERSIFRIDHFLGMSTVLNLLGFRFANRIFEPVWNREHVEGIAIVFDEELGLEGRAGYYDSAGALVDMIQSHLLQVMAMMTMEPPASLGEQDLRGAIAQTLRATRVWDDDPATASRRARYTAGSIGDRELPAYIDEDGVDPGRETETLAELIVEVDNWRWAGVPITLRSGKALGEPRTEIVVTFRHVPHVPEGLQGAEKPTALRISLESGGLSLDLNVNGPGDPRMMERVALETALHPGQLAAYGEVVQGVLNGDPALSIRGDVTEQCWRIVDSVLETWARSEVPMDDYPAGSPGPRKWT